MHGRICVVPYHQLLHLVVHLVVSYHKLCCYHGVHIYDRIILWFVIGGSDDGSLVMGQNVWWMQILLDSKYQRSIQ